MTSARLLSVVFLLCPLFGFAQEQSQPPKQPAQAATPDSSSSRPTDDQQRKAELAAEVASQFLASYHYDPNSGDRPWVNVSPDGKILAWGVEKTCYAIRSYVVERDEKDSDSTHLVHTSTCVPANQYGIKTAVERQDVGHQNSERR
jgi:hypothetical protein